MDYNQATVTGSVYPEAVIPADFAELYKLRPRVGAAPNVLENLPMHHFFQDEYNNVLANMAMAARDNWLNAGVPLPIAARMYTRVTAPSWRSMPYPEVEELNPEQRMSLGEEPPEQIATLDSLQRAVNALTGVRPFEYPSPWFKSYY